WRVEKVLGSRGFGNMPVVYTGDKVSWQVRITNNNLRQHPNIKIITKVDGVPIDDMIYDVRGPNLIPWLAHRGWRATEENLHKVSFELISGGKNCDIQNWQIPVLKPALSEPRAIERPMWLRPRLIDGFQRLSDNIRTKR
ncbi:MAG: hypothetical protein NTZ34_11815, partial [Chloroflexi bacterium]|nr:hypothetical protein [Chloroflexota bacterium]